jgi:hypothetical protein
MNRRQFVASTGIIMSMSAAGCSSDSATSTSTENTADETERSNTATQSQEPPTQSVSETPRSEITNLIDETITLPEGDNFHADFSVSSPATVEYNFTVQDDIEIDLFVLSLSDFQKYQSRQSFTTIETVDSSGGTGTVSVSRGNYYVVLDHSDRGPTSPPGQFEQVSATIDATISYTSQ